MPPTPGQLAGTDDIRLLARTAANNLDRDIQLACTRNPNATAATLIVLATSPDPQVAATAARHPGTPTSMLARLSERTNPTVVAAAAAALERRGHRPG